MTHGEQPKEVDAHPCASTQEDEGEEEGRANPNGAGKPCLRMKLKSSLVLKQLKCDSSKELRRAAGAC